MLTHCFVVVRLKSVAAVIVVVVSVSNGLQKNAGMFRLFPPFLPLSPFFSLSRQKEPARGERKKGKEEECVQAVLLSSTRHYTVSSSSPSSSSSSSSSPPPSAWDDVPCPLSSLFLFFFRERKRTPLHGKKIGKTRGGQKNERQPDHSFVRSTATTMYHHCKRIKMHFFYSSNPPARCFEPQSLSSYLSLPPCSHWLGAYTTTTLLTTYLLSDSSFWRRRLPRNSLT